MVLFLDINTSSCCVLSLIHILEWTQVLKIISSCASWWESSGEELTLSPYPITQTHTEQTERKLIVTAEWDDTRTWKTDKLFFIFICNWTTVYCLTHESIPCFTVIRYGSCIYTTRRKCYQLHVKAYKSILWTVLSRWLSEEFNKRQNKYFLQCISWKLHKVVMNAASPSSKKGLQHISHHPLAPVTVCVAHSTTKRVYLGRI